MSIKAAIKELQMSKSLNIIAHRASKGQKENIWEQKLTLSKANEIVIYGFKLWNLIDIRSKLFCNIFAKDEISQQSFCS